MSVTDGEILERVGLRFAPLADDVLPDPYPQYARLREAGRIHWSGRLESWLITTHRDCVDILQDVERFGSDPRRVGEDLPTAFRNLQSLDPPDHFPIRRLVSKAIAAQDFPALERDTYADCVARLRALEAAGTCDFVHDVVEPVALGALTRLLGVPIPDVEWFVRVSDAIARAMDSGLDPSAHEPGIEARETLAELAASWLAGTGEDGAVAFFRRAAAEVSVDPDVAASSLRVLFHAGFESAARFTGLAVFHTLRRGLTRELAASDFDTALRELARFDSPVQAEARYCVSDTDLGEVRIKRGEVVVLLMGSANRDATVFESPDEVDLRRPPNMSIAFGRGVHSCPGRDFALSQGRAIVRALIDTYPESVISGQPVFKRHATLRGLAQLPVTLKEK